MAKKAGVVSTYANMTNEELLARKKELSAELKRRVAKAQKQLNEMLAIVGEVEAEIATGTPKVGKKRTRASEEEIEQRIKDVLDSLKGTSAEKSKPLAKIAEETGLSPIEIKATFPKIKKSGKGEVKKTGSLRDAAWFLHAKGG